MLIILEGCDGSGKSTLAKWLSQLLNAEIIHCSATTPNDMSFFSRIVEAAETKNIIADRFCYGQFVYQSEAERPLATNHSTAWEQLGYLESKMIAAGVRVIYVTASEKVIAERLQARGESLMKGHTISKILESYKDVKNHSILTWLEYNTGGEE